MQNLKENIAKNLIKFRTDAGLTQFELAEKINYSDKSISKWERGIATPDCFVLKTLADFYNIKVDDFFNENNTPIKIENNKTKVSKKILMPLIVSGLVWLIACLTFVVLHWLNIPNSYLSFVIAIPSTFVVFIVYSSIWWKFYTVYIFISGLIWSLAITLDAFFKSANDYLFYIICIPLQILIVLILILRCFIYKGKKKNKN